MPSRVQTLRSSTANQRPAAGSREPGEIFLNFSDRQIGYIDAAKTPIDLVPVRFYVTTTAYAVGAMVVQAGLIYRCVTATTAGAFVAANWVPVGEVIEAPNDGKPYVRQSKAWAETLTKASLDAGFTDLDTRLDTVEADQITQNTAIGLRAPIASPTFTGDPKAPTPATADNDTSVATTAFVQANLASYAPLASPVLTGNPTAPTQAPGDVDTSIATTAFVAGAVANRLTDAPADGKTYGRKDNAWATVVGGATISDTPPGGVKLPGQMWFESDTGNTFIWYDDGNTTQWVQINAGAGSPAIATDAPIDGNSYFRQDGVWSAGVVQFNAGIIAHKAQVAVGYVKQKGAAVGDYFVWRVTDDGTAGGANNKLKMTLFDSPDTALNLIGASPFIGFYPNNSLTVRVGFIQSLSAGPLTINGETVDINIRPASTLWVGPRTTAVAASARQYISYLGLANQYGLNLVAENAAGTSFPIVFTYPPSTTVGAISHTSTTTTYATTSDERLKDFDGPLTGDEAVAIIRADPVRHFTWKLDGSSAVGWSAQASHAVSPDLAVQGDDLGPDAKVGDEGFMTWGMDQAKRAPYLWAALAHALDKIDALEARLAAVETR